MPPIALSLTEELEKFGAYAGLAAFFGLAVLTILYFAQSREVKRLREWAGRAPERAAELEARVAADAARRVTLPPRQPPPPPPGAAPAPATAAGAPAATSGPGAATPAGAGAVTAAPPAEAGNGAGDGADEPPAATPATDGPADTSAPAPPADGEPAPAAPPGEPATAGNGEPPPVPRATPQPAAAPPAPRRPAPAPLRQPPPATRRPTPPPRRPGSPPPDPPERGRSRTAVAVGAGLVAAVFAVLIAVQLFGGDDRPAPPNVPAPAESTATQDPATEPEEGTEEAARSETTVAVLNGTTVTGLAAEIADDIEAAGFARGATANYSDQARSASLVFHTEAFRRRAQEVARIIDLPAEDVEPITDDVRSLAGDADVVVVVGADQAP